VRSYVDLLRNSATLFNGYETAPDNIVRTFFQYAVLSMSDCWRRLCFSVMSFPYVMFRLACTSTTSEFVMVANELTTLRGECEQCADLEFSGPILHMLKDISKLSAREQRALEQKVKGICKDVAAVGPISTDVVECRHGQLQNTFARFRGSHKITQTAAEESILESIASAHSCLVEQVKPEHLPPHHAHILAQAGDSSKGNASSTQDDHGQRKQRLPTAERLAKASATSGKRRRLSGFLFAVRAELFPFGGVKYTVCQYAAICNMMT
jgi:hypothetical protein